MAEARKTQVEMTRKRNGVEVPEEKGASSSEIDQDIPQIGHQNIQFLNIELVT